MKLRVFQIDAFASEVFKGNPAAVCPLETWLPDQIMQKIAEENNLSETAFIVERESRHHIRWFTPAVEVNLCGHATLAAAWVLVNELGKSQDILLFDSRSGELKVSHSGGRLTLDFPVQRPASISIPEKLLPALGVSSAPVLGAEDFLVVIDKESQLLELEPNFSLLKGLPLRGVIVTAPGEKVDFVSRWFGPNVGVNEDPVTGSAHTTLAPYWAERLKKQKLVARQISQRGGQLECEVVGDRVFIAGNAVKYMEGTIYI